MRKGRSCANGTRRPFLHTALKPYISTHSFRKFYATEIYNDNGYNIVLVQQLLQHSSAAVTQRYIGIQQQELEKAIEGHLMLEF